MDTSLFNAPRQARTTGVLAVGIFEALFLGALLFVQADYAHAQTATTTPPVVSNVVATSTTPTTATITWMTDTGATSQVAYGTTTAYGAWSAYDPTPMTSHVAMLSGLLASTTYHYQVRSAGTSTATTTSADQTFMTMAVPDTTPPVISSLGATATTTSATISWTTNEPTSMQVSYGPTSAYTASSTLDSTLMTSHMVTVSGLVSGTTYHYQARSADSAGNVATSSDQMFTTTSMGTSTATTTPDFMAIQAEINRLWQKIAELMALIQQLIAGGGGNNNGGSVYPPYTPSGPAFIDQNGETVEMGRSINFLGHNFTREEDVTVMTGGMMMKTVHADGGGNFSTGSMSVPNMPGTYTYTFTGKESGRVATAMITVVPEN